LKIEIEVLKQALWEVPATTRFQENDIFLGFGYGFVITRDEFKHGVAFICHFLSSKNSFGTFLYEKGENRLLKTRDFLEMTVFVVKLKLSLSPKKE
jgi:hypothetical protein